MAVLLYARCLRSSESRLVRPRVENEKCASVRKRNNPRNKKPQRNSDSVSFLQQVKTTLRTSEVNGASFC